MHHGGFFCGIGQNRKYFDEQVDTFDELDRGTFCCVFIDKMLTDLGYTTADRRIRVYWCKAGHTSSDGLVAINFEKHADLMKKASKEEKTLDIFVDHVNLLEKQRWDDVIQQPQQLPAVISPVKGNYKHKGKEVEQPQHVSKEHEHKSEDVEAGGANKDEDSDGGAVMSCCSANSDDGDSDFVDSDYDLDDDDEQWTKNVDEGVKDDLVDKAAAVHVEKHPEIVQQRNRPGKSYIQTWHGVC